jgi:hypothetical protein
MSTSPKFNRILLPELGFLRWVEIEGQRKGIRDSSAFPYQVEEMIALGAIEVAVGATIITDDLIKSLPTSLKKRVVQVDKRGICRQRVDSLFAPIAEELGMEPHNSTALSFRKQDKNLPQDKNLLEAAATVYFSLYPFLIGMEHGLQVDIDLQGVIQSLKTLRENLRSGDARVTAAILLGVFQTYRTVPIPALIFESAAPEQLLKLFEDFVRDETYRHLSMEAHKLGLPTKAKRAINLMGRYVHKLFQRPTVRQIADLSSKGISVVTQLPIPNSDMADALLRKGFLPPIVSLGSAMRRSWLFWSNANPEIDLRVAGKNDVKKCD